MTCIQTELRTSQPWFPKSKLSSFPENVELLFRVLYQGCLNVTRDSSSQVGSTNFRQVIFRVRFVNALKINVNIKCRGNQVFPN